MHEKLYQVKNALLSVPCNLFHYYAVKKPDKYIVWAENGEASSLEADGQKQDQVIGGYIDYFTKEDNDPNVALIQEALASAEIAFSLNDVAYEEETKYIHYAWKFEVV